jgi:hypothetical protein
MSLICYLPLIASIRAIIHKGHRSQEDTEITELAEITEADGRMGEKGARGFLSSPLLLNIPSLIPSSSVISALSVI